MDNGGIKHQMDNIHWRQFGDKQVINRFHLIGTAMVNLILSFIVHQMEFGIAYQAEQDKHHLPSLA
jgi:hypothetical protein